MESATILHLQTILRSKASQHSIVYNTNPITQHVCLVHRVSCQHHRPILVFLAILQYVPELSSSIRVKACCGLIQENNLWR